MGAPDHIPSRLGFLFLAFSMLKPAKQQVATDCQKPMEWLVNGLAARVMAIQPQESLLGNVIGLGRVTTIHDEKAEDRGPVQSIELVDILTDVIRCIARGIVGSIRIVQTRITSFDALPENML